MNELGSKAMELIAKMESVAPRVWDVHMRQAYIEGCVNVCAVVVLCVAMVAAFRRASSLFKQARDHDGYSLRGDEQQIAAVALGAAGGLCVLFAFIFAQGALTCLLNPEYRAFHMLLENIK